MTSGVCSIEGCGRRLDARGMCSTHRRRQRLGLPMDAPIRTRACELTISDLLTAAFETYEADAETDYQRKRRRFASMAKRWAACQ